MPAQWSVPRSTMTIFSLPRTKIALLLTVVWHSGDTMQQPRDAPPTKRRKLSVDLPNEPVPLTQPETRAHKGLDRPISPPLSKRNSPGSVAASLTPTWSFDTVPKQTAKLQPAESTRQEKESAKGKDDGSTEVRVVSSPVQLTRIENLGKEQNIDTVGLADLLGDPLIKECWNFNYLFDLDFVM